MYTNLKLTNLKIAKNSSRTISSLRLDICLEWNMENHLGHCDMDWRLLAAQRNYLIRSYNVEKSASWPHVCIRIPALKRCCFYSYTSDALTKCSIRNSG